MDSARAAGAGARDHDAPILKGRPPVSFLLELFAFMKARKKFWLLPMLLMMVVFGGLIVMAKGSAVAPFIYTLF